MANSTECCFCSPLAAVIERLIEEKRACGYQYVSSRKEYLRLDRFLCTQALSQPELPREVVTQWIAKRPNESVRTHRARAGVVRRLAEFMVRHGYSAYIGDQRLSRLERSPFIAHVFSRDEIGRLLTAAEQLRPNPCSPLRHRVLPELFYVLYGCGLRISEALQLRVGEVDLRSAVLTVRQGKFRKDRLVPLAPRLAQRLQHYAEGLNLHDAEQIFFPTRYGEPYHPGSIYVAFRQLLWQCGIPHGGRGQGPRLHDIRHSYAVHRLVQWYREGADLNAKLAVLATYLGHQNISDTQHYLRLTAELFPDLNARLEATFGDIIPRRTTS